MSLDCGSRRPSRSALVLCLLLAPLGVGTAYGQSADGAAANAPTARVEEIVVSARRRAELLQDTPISVTAISAEDLTQKAVTQINEVQDLVPNVTINRTHTGESIAVITRGVGNFPDPWREQGTPIYIDGVVLARNAGSVLNIVDVAQVEFLRGPQGTLFGKNSLGGALSITTVKPQPEFQAEASIRAGEYGTFEPRLMLNIPIIEDQLAVRMNFAHFQREGYFYNEFLDEYLSDRNSQNVLVATRWTPTQDFTLDVSATYTASHSKGLGGQCTPIDIAFEDSTEIAYSPEQAAEYRRRCEASGRFLGQSEVNAFSRAKSYGVWSIAEYVIGDVGFVEDLAVKFTGSWRQQEVGARFDLDSSNMSAAVVATGGGEGPYDGTPTWQNQLQAELQVSGTAWEDRIHFIGGVFSFWEQSRSEQGLRFFEDTEAPLRDIILDISLSNNFATTKNNDWALFGQATADITDWASLTAGIRYTRETKRLSRLLLQPENPEPTAVEFNGKVTFDAFTPMASIALTMPQEWLDGLPIHHLMGYFTYSRGFRGGGFNGGARTENSEAVLPFEPEFIDSYELGVKTILLGGRLFVNASIFRANRDEMQVNQFLTFQEPGDPLIRTDVLVRNAAKARTQGIELEVLARPIEGLVINGTLGHLDTFYIDYTEAQNAVTGEAPFDRSGQKLGFVPRFQSSLGIQYTLPLPETGVDMLNGYITPRIDWAWRDDTTYWSPEIGLVDGDRNIVNIRISYDFNDDRSQIAFWGTNMLDHEYFQETIALPRTTGVATRYWGQPRTMGVQLTHKF